MIDWLRVLGTHDLNMEFLRALLAEFIGSFFFVLIGTLATSFKPRETEWPRASPVQIAFAFGTTAFSISHSLGPISSAHINPSVTLSVLLICGMSLICCIGYIIAQLAGGLAAAGIVALTLDAELYQEQHMLRPLMGVSYVEIGLVEGVASFLWVFMAMVTIERRHEDAMGNSSFAIFFTVAAAYLVSMVITGGGVNPVRSLVAALLLDEWEFHAAYWLGPFSGGCVAAIIYLRFFGPARNLSIYRTS